MFRTYDGIAVSDLNSYIVDRLPPSYDTAARNRYIIQIGQRIQALAGKDNLITCDTFCELMRSFNLTEEEVAKGCWSDERLLNHFMQIHFKYQSGLDVGDQEITQEMFAAYVDRVCRLKGQN